MIKPNSSSKNFNYAIVIYNYAIMISFVKMSIFLS